MNRSDILGTLNAVFQNVLGDEIVIKDSTVASDIEQWDSMNHIKLMMATERRFKVSFTANEIVGLHNVGDLVDLVLRKSSGGKAKGSREPEVSK